MTPKRPRRDHGACPRPGCLGRLPRKTSQTCSRACAAALGHYLAASSQGGRRRAHGHLAALVASLQLTPAEVEVYMLGWKNGARAMRTRLSRHLQTHGVHAHPAQ